MGGRGGPLRALVVGAGYMGRHHLDGYRSHAGARPVGAVSRSAQTAAAIEERYSIPCYVDLGRALAETAPDVVSVCSPTQHHAAHAMAALEADCHVLVEKPLTAELAEGKALLSRARAARRLVMPAHTTLFEPAIFALVRLVMGAAVGTVRRVEFERRGQDVSPGEVEKGNVPDNRTGGGTSGEAGGGASALAETSEDPGWLYDHAVHVTYLLNRLAGAAPRAVAVGERVRSRWGETLQARVDYTNGVVARVDITSRAEDEFSKRVRVFGDEGQVRWTFAGGRNRLELEQDGDSRAIPFAGGSAFEAVVHHFVDAVRTGRRPLESGADGLKAMALAANLAGGFPPG